MSPSLFIKISRISALIILGIFLAVPTITLSPHMFAFSPDRPGCDAPIPYRIESSDSRFPLGPDAFRRAAFEAEAIWERGIGKDLFVYDPSGSLVIRTEFDERQKMTYEARDLESEVSRYKTEAEKIKQEYDSAVAKYKKDETSFRKDADAFNKKLADYNKDVQKWNISETRTIEEFEALEKRRKKLEEDERRLVTTSEKIGKLAEGVNALAGTMSGKTADINRNISTFRERYGEPKPFVQGLYDPSAPSVTIFQFEDQDDLRLVIAHELGHALGIEDHVESDSSLMYYLMGGQNLERPTLSAEDADAYATTCPTRSFSKRDAIVRALVLTPIKNMRAWDFVSILMKE